MKFSTFVALGALVSPSLAFPFLGHADPEQLKAILEDAQLQKREASAPLEERQLGLGGLIGSLTALLSTVRGLLGAVANNIDPNNLRPEPGFEFREPGPNDSRGPCPGLNLLANHGYLPRNGLVNFGQVLEATSRGYNMAPDLAAVLTVFSILTGGDIATESFYLGTGPGNVGGLNRHSTAECDISPNREDFYNACGDNHHLSSRKFKQLVGIVGQSASKQFDVRNMAAQYAENARFSRANNPFLYFFPFPSIVALGAYPFYPNFFSNGTYGAGGVASYESITSHVGARLNERTGNFEYVPERFPPRWYRRATPYGAVQTVADILLQTYPANPIPMGVPQFGTPNLNANTLLCDVYQGINSITPLVLAQPGQDVGAAIGWALSKLAPFIAPSVLGCPLDVLSPNYNYPNATQPGGPGNLPPSRSSNVGNNVYGRAYFAEAPPRQPQC
ncbi:Dothistromin biosynthesis peroxidase dotB-like protein 1 [Elsinoe fawcettii]|nr:Dothistromin biosynthesis peroxidase dotB-like protein 1 [Elsinoe fawcettii]